MLKMVSVCEIDNVWPASGISCSCSDEISAEQRQAVQQFLQRLELWIADTLARAHLLPVSKPDLARVIVSALEGALLLDRDQAEPLRLQAVCAWLKTITRL